jgi:hypothetical protein
MAKGDPVYGAHNDNVNQVFSILGVIGTLGTSDVGGTANTLPIGVDPDNGAIFTKAIDGAPNSSYGDNPSYKLQYDSAGNLGTVTKYLGTASYVKTLGYDVSNNLSTVSVWV